MRTLVFAALLAAIPSVACPSIASAQGYFEASVGFGLFPDIETNGYSYNTPVATPYAGLFEGNAEVEINSSWAFGAESGWRSGAWRFGGSWDFIDVETDTARLEGTLNGVPFSLVATDEELEDFGIEASYDVHIFAANAYYMFNSYTVGGINMGVQPYIGLGGGAATFENMDAQFAFLVTLGVNVPIGPSGYIGGRYRATFISGPSNDGIEFDGFTTHTFSLVLGIQLSS